MKLPCLKSDAGRRQRHICGPLAVFLLFFLQVWRCQGIFGGDVVKKIEILNPSGVLCENARCYVVEFSNVTMACVLNTENNNSTIKFTYDINVHEKLKDNESLRNSMQLNFQNSTFLNFTMHNISTEWVAENVHQVHPGCVIVGCPHHDESCTDWLTVEVTRKPKPIRFSEEDCVVDDWLFMQCEWSPTFKEQAIHTKLSGRDEPIQQTVRWDVIYSPDGEIMGSRLERNFQNDSLRIHGEDFKMGAVYKFEVIVQALRPEDEHSENATVQVNTTRIVKPHKVRDVEKVANSTTSDSVAYTWTLPFSHGYSIDVVLNYTCTDWRHPSSIEGCSGTEAIRNNISYTLMGLIPYANYSVEIRVKAIGSIHASDPMKSTFQTRPSVPRKNPSYSVSMFYVSRTNATGCGRDDCVRVGSCSSSTQGCAKATLYWQLLHASDYCGPEFSYVIEYSFGVSARNKTVSQNTSHFDVFFERDKETVVRILSRNRLGVNMEQEKIIKVSVSDDKVTDLMVQSDNGTDITVTWRMQSDKAESYKFLLLWCNRTNKVADHECGSQVFCQDLAVTRTESGKYSITRRVVEFSKFKYNEMLVGVAAENCEADGVHCGNVADGTRSKRAVGGTASTGIVWADALYLLSRDPDGSIRLLTHSKDGSIVAEWTYVCDNICGLPKEYKVVCCLKRDNECEEYVTGSTTYKINDLIEAEEYSVEIQVEHKDGTWVKLSTKQTATPKASGLSRGIIAGIVVCGLLVLLSPLGVYACVRYIKQGHRWFHGLTMILPRQVERPKAPLGSGSSGNYIIGSQSSDGHHYFRNISQDSRDSQTALLHDHQHPSRHRANGAAHATSLELIANDNVFTDDIPMETYTIPSRTGFIGHRSFDLDDPWRNPLGVVTEEETSGNCLNPAEGESHGDLEPYNVITTVPLAPLNDKLNASKPAVGMATPLEAHSDLREVPDSFDALATNRSNMATAGRVNAVGNGIASQHMPSSRSEPVSVQPSRLMATENVDSSMRDNYVDDVNARPEANHGQQLCLQPRREPVENYCKYYSSFGGSKASPAKPSPVVSSVLGDDRRVHSEPHLANEPHGVPKNMKLLSTGYVSIENGVDDAAQVEKTPVEINLNRKTNGPVESELFVDLPEQPVFYDSDIELEKKRAQNAASKARCESPYVVASGGGFVVRDSPPEPPPPPVKKRQQLVAKVSPTTAALESDNYCPTSLTYDVSATPPSGEEDAAHDYCSTLANTPADAISPSHEATCASENNSHSNSNDQSVPRLEPLVVQLPASLHGCRADPEGDYRPTEVRFDSGLAMRPDEEENSDSEYCKTEMYVTNGQLTEVQ